MDLPYKAEYAKSGRAGCRGCKSTIAQGTLRLAVMVQSAMFDGKTPQWYHYMCFFNKQRPKTTDDIEHFESLRYEDQEKIKEKVASGSAVVVPEKKGKKRGAASSAKNSALRDFTIEYAKSGRAMCRGCEQKIMKDEIRIAKKDFESEAGRKYGGENLWHHLTCFAKLRAELGYFESADILPGFNTLSAEDKKEAKKQLPPIKQEDVPDIKKIKTEDSVDGIDERENQIKEQNQIMFKYRDQLQKNLSKQQLSDLLEYNQQKIPVGADNMLDLLCDIMTFGALKPCKECNGGQYRFTKLGYQCNGNLTEWTKCNNISKEPARSKFKVPKEFAEEFPFLKKYKYKSMTRILRDVNPTKSVKKEEEEDGKPKVERALPALYNMEFVIFGQPSRGKDVLKKQITSLGGKVVTKIKNTVMAVIASEEDVEKKGARITEAEVEGIHVVPEDFVDEAKENAGKIPDLIIKKSICDWGSDPTTRLPQEPTSSGKSKSKSRSVYTSSVPSKLKLKVKGGGAVDPDSGLEDIAHVYEDRDNKYTAVLGVTDIQKQKNSYYKLQVLAGDSGSRYWLFRSWGRIGTTIGGNKLEDMTTLTEALHQFRALYEEKSGNPWENRHHFVKVPGRMYPIDIDYGDEDASQKMDIVEAPSELKPPVQNLIKMIFDVKTMNKLMLEFELDTEKMPLGKLSKKQIQSAYKVLTELQNLIENGGSDSRFIDASNRFYTFIPHSFGVEDPPVLKDPEVIKQKIELLDNLMELEIAYSLMKSSGNEHTVDSYYKQLNTEIDILHHETEEFKLIHEYVQNTHAETHSGYELVIEDIYIVKRQGEDRRFKPFRKLHNRKLLWHGSRVTNFAGILSQGLRIAPPEAPMTGYMFGKGIYFADMVSKSANYCCSSISNSKGLLLLCEVALGDMYERYSADYIEKLPKGKHSTKGVGRTEPDPDMSKIVDGVEIPLGKGKTLPDRNHAELLYNEYIVYDVAQVNVKYLLKMHFKYKY